MTRYLDASAVVPLYVNEAASPAVRRWFGARPPDDVILSRWTLAEFTSALGIRTRMGTISPAAARGVVAAFRALVQGSIAVLRSVPTSSTARAT